MYNARARVPASRSSRLAHPQSARHTTHGWGYVNTGAQPDEKHAFCWFSSAFPSCGHPTLPVLYDPSDDLSLDLPGLSPLTAVRYDHQIQLDRRPPRVPDSASNYHSAAQTAPGAFATAATSDAYYPLQGYLHSEVGSSRIRAGEIDEQREELTVIDIMIIGLRTTPYVTSSQLYLPASRTELGLEVWLTDRYPLSHLKFQLVFRVDDARLSDERDLWRQAGVNGVPPPRGDLSQTSWRPSGGLYSFSGGLFALRGGADPSTDFWALIIPAATFRISLRNVIQ
ncbi:uncharacterized protein BXZ73DRAFT_79074 [Epithele typhae]|uniref:uncharacterized protein n=1 Tax=Epithele typhae TaxID=378194 RepID=UPI0020082260|nr:uncharacterized protein BXZ73DRAFT_79074 [Epithele typhae]KAH9925423.1 hypothetical protein BXZ73DRAFT_79074 [Epithele typhae]